MPLLASYLLTKIRPGKTSWRPCGYSGTADIPVAEEAAITADLHGSQVERIYDVGCCRASPLIDRIATLQKAR